MKHGRERGVEGAGAPLARECVVVVVELVVFHHHKRAWVLDELLAGGGHLQQAVVLHLLLQVAHDERLADDGVPYLRILVFARAKLLQLIVVVGHNLVGLAASDEVDDIVGAEVLLDGQDGLEGDDQLVGCFNLRAWVQAVVAVVAVVFLILLAKVVQQHLPSAHAGLGVGRRFLQQLPPDVLLGHGFALHKLVELLQVFVAVEGDAHPLAAVAPGAPRLLVVSFQALGDVVVDDEAHVGLVDAHAEGDGGHDDVDFLHQEVILRLCACGGVQSGVVALRLDVVGAQHLGQVFHLLARETVDDAALAGVLLDESHDILVDVLGLLPHLVVEVGAVERRLELLGVDDAQVLLDVGAHLVGGGGGERNHGCRANLVDDGPDAAVLRTEVVAPLRDTVRLVDGIERHFHRAQELHVVLFRQALRRHIEQLGAPAADVGLHLVDGRLGERRVEEVGRALVLAQVRDEVHLVLHQRDEGRDDDGHAVHQQRRQLIAQRLASAGGHQHKGVVAFQHVVDDGLLVALEGVEAEVLLQCLRKVSFLGHRLACVIPDATCRAVR